MVRELSIKTALVLIICVFFCLYWSTFSKLIDIWSSSHTYGHGFFIPPIVAWLIYRKKQQIAQLNIAISLLGLMGVFGVSIFWFLAKLSGINVAEQFAVLILPLFIIWSIWGLLGIRLLAFPLFFLIFAVPVGDFLIPYLQFITADISVFMLEILGIPVYRDGMYIQIPNGNFLVAEACSGIRFLISTFTIGVLFAYLNIQSIQRRSLFIILCLIVPIIGNGLRAFLIILIGYLSDMQAAVGFDHLVYGAVFFSFILIVLLIIGHYIAEPIKPENDKQQKSPPKPLNKISSFTLILLVIALSSGAGIHFVHTAQIETFKPQLVAQKIKQEKAERLFDWQPYFINADAIYYRKTEENHQVSDIFLIDYLYESENKELINGNNRFFDKAFWSLDEMNDGSVIDSNGERIHFIEYRIVNMKGEERIIRVVYVIDDEFFAQKIAVKLAQLASKLLMNDFGGRALIFSTENDGDGAERLDWLMKRELINAKPDNMLRID